jgi:cell division septum initiation protein DivIVA
MTEAEALLERIDELEAELTVYRLMAATIVATIVAAAAVGVMA